MDDPVGADRHILVGPVHYRKLCPAGRRLLEDAGFTLLENESTRPWTGADLAPLLGRADAAICGVEEYSREILEQAPRLRVIARLGVGLDNIDLDAARALGVDVVNVPGGNASAVAELTIALMLSVLRKVPAMDAGLRQGHWDRHVGHELSGKTVGLIGFGAIARLVARRLSGFDVTIRAYDPYASPAAAEELGVTLGSLDEVIGDADVVSVHAPRTPETHHLVDADILTAMPRRAVLINTSRGGIVDETALVEALERGEIAGAGLDVFEHEPLPPEHPLLRLDTVVVTMHAAADSVEAYHHIGMSTAQAVIDVFSGREPEHLAN
jgi:D-3-phosphoglycerate dehydrogenase